MKIKAGEQKKNANMSNSRKRSWQKNWNHVLKKQSTPLCSGHSTVTETGFTLQYKQSPKMGKYKKWWRTRSDPWDLGHYRGETYDWSNLSGEHFRLWCTKVKLRRFLTDSSSRGDKAMSSGRSKGARVNMTDY